jgi:hypothetical protein
MTLVPARALGVLSSRAGIAGPLAETRFGDVRQAVPPDSFRTGSATVMQVGRVYLARSRNTGGGGCNQHAKFQPLEIDLAEARMRLQITTNERCSDLRLVPED